MKKYRFSICAVILLMTIFIGGAWAAIPRMINLQGVLKDSISGVPASGSYTASIKYFAANNLNNPLLTVDNVNIDPDENGFFSIDLTVGSLDFTIPYLVSLEIAGLGTFNQLLAAVPYAITAQNVKGGTIEAVSGYFSDRVGIGNSNPVAALQVTGDSQFDGKLQIGKPAAGPALQVSGETVVNSGRVGVDNAVQPKHLLDLGWAPFAKLAVYQNDQGNDFYGLGVPLPTDKLEVLAKTGQLVIDTAGKIGLRTSQPTETLQISYGNIKLDNSGKGIVLNAYDGPMITRGSDPFTYGSYLGIGRWGMFMEPQQLSLVIPKEPDKYFNFKAVNGNFTSPGAFLSMTNRYINASSYIPRVGFFQEPNQVSSSADISERFYIAGLDPTQANDCWLYWDQATRAIYYGDVGSSRRYKENIVPLRDDFSKILKAEPRSFTYKENGVRDIGYIAEELDELGLKNLVEYDAAGRPNNVKYEKIPLYLLEVLKRQRERLAAVEEKQRRELADLRAKIAELK